MFMFNSCLSEKKYPEIEVKLIFLTFFIIFFVENQEHNQERLLMHIVKNICHCQASLPLLLT